MSSILLMRHGEPDYSGPRRWGTPGWGGDLAPLSESGEKQVLNSLDILSQFDPAIILSSPTTRALHSATIVASELGKSLKVDFNLHEWVPKLDFSWRTEAEVLSQLKELETKGGEWPHGESLTWEPLMSVRKRGAGAIRKVYDGKSKVLVVCHEILIWALTGIRHTPLAGVRPLSHEELLKL